MAAMRPAAGLARNQALCDQRADVERQIHQQLLAALVGEEIDDAVECLVGAVGVQRREHQVPGLGELDAVFHGLAVADLADQDHIRCLPQGVPEGAVPGIGVDADLAVRDDAALVLMHEFHRVLDGDDVAAGFLVAIARPWSQAWLICRSRCRRR